MKRFNAEVEEVVVDTPVYGPKIGLHLGKPIYKSIERNGYRYEYDRLAHCDEEGCPLDQLNQNEVLIKPGLIYRMAS